MASKRDYPAAAINGMQQGLAKAKGGAQPPLVGNLYSLIGYAIGQVKPAELKDGGGEQAQAMLDALNPEEGKSICWSTVIQAATGMLQVLFPTGIQRQEGESPEEENGAEQPKTPQPLTQPPPHSQEGRGHI